MPKFNDFDLDIQLNNAQLNAENPTKVTIDGPSAGTFLCTKKHYDCIATYDCTTIEY